MVEKMQAVLKTFASYGSGWVLQQVIQVKLTKFSPIRRSSFIDLPFWNRESQNLININNHHDHNCFELCFTGAYKRKKNFWKFFYFGRILFGRWKLCFVWKKNFFLFGDFFLWKKNLFWRQTFSVKKTFLGGEKIFLLKKKFFRSAKNYFVFKKKIFLDGDFFLEKQFFCRRKFFCDHRFLIFGKFLMMTDF